MNKEKVYQILLIEDDESDVDLIRIQLGKLKADTELEVIHQKEQLVEKLDNNPPDLIISDYNLPTFTGVEALQIVREKFPELPFILVSGYIGEEKAADAMLKGASDYAMKDHLDRLGPAILRELSNYREQQEKNRELILTRDRYQSLVQTVNGIVWEAEAKTFAFTYISPQVEEILGYSPSQWYESKTFWQDHIHPEDREKAIRFCRNQTREGENHSFEYRMIAESGDAVWLRDYVSVLSTKDQPDKLRGLMVDITAQKRAERQRDKAYDIANIGHWELDLVNDNLIWSDAIKKLHEVDREYEPDLETAINFYKEGDHRQKITEAVEHAIESGEGFDLELKIITAKGNERWIRAIGETEYRNGKCLRIFGSTQDITRQKENELKLQNIVEYSTNMFYQHDENHVLNYVSPQAKDFLGYSPEEAKKRWTEFVTDHPINEQGFRQTQKAIDTGEAQPSFPLQLKKKNGEIIWVRVNEAPITENGKTVAIVGSLTDITERKNYEEQLQESLERYEYVTEATSDAVWDWNLLDDSVYWGKGFETLFGHSIHKLTDDRNSWTDHIHPKDRDRVQQSIQNVIDGSLQNWENEYRFLKADGNYAFVEDRGFVIRDSDGKALRMIGAMRDITEEKKADRQIKEANKKLETAQQIAKLGYWEMNVNTQEIYWSDQTYKIYGMNPDKDTIDLQTVLDHFHPDDYEYAVEQNEQALQNRESLKMEHRIVLPDGSVKWIQVIGNFEDSGNGDPVIEGTIQDITEKKELEFLLNQTNRLARIGIWEIDFRKENEHPVFWSKITKEILEVDKTFRPTLEQTYDFFEEESLEKFQDSIQDAIEKGTPFTEELLMVSAKGNRCWVRCIGKPDFTDGKCNRLYGSFQDIHERKVSELELAKRNSFIETTLQNLPIGISVHEIDSGENVLLNKKFSDIYGWPQEELHNVDAFFEKVYPDEDYRREMKTKILEDMESGDHERMQWNNVRITTKSGDTKIINAKNIPLFDQNQMISTVVDVTAEKEAKEEKVRTLERIGDAFFSVDQNWTVTYWNKKAEKVLGKPKEEIVGKNLWDEYEEAMSLEFYTQYHKAVEEQAAVHFEEYYPPVSKWFEVNAYPSESGLSVFFRNITERKANEEHIKRINERFEKATEATNDAIWDFNVVDDHLFWGRGFETLFGYDLQKVNPTLDFLISLIHPEDRKRIAENIQHHMKPGSKTDWYEEYRFKRKDGSYAYVMDRAIFIRNEEDKVVRVVGAMTDLTKQKAYEESLKELNAELQEYAKELAQSNAELEQFAYVASHDLQEPLRMVSSFLSRLEEKYADQLDEKALKYIDFAVDGAARMRQIILDLLNYSRVGQGNFEKEEVDLEDLMEEILKLEQTAIADNGAAITWSKLPKINAAKTPIQQVFQNLINNAIKYRKPNMDPEIHIKGEESKTHWKFSVTDNGIGIQEEFQDNIFNIFQRLHTQDQYSGTGIGLAVTKKIVERHGGEIWVESEEGEGSTFHFTIAKE